MKELYKDIVENDEQYHRVTKKYERGLVTSVLKKIGKVRLTHKEDREETIDDKIIELHSIVESGGDKVYAQYRLVYDKRNKTLEIETLYK